MTFLNAKSKKQVIMPGPTISSKNRRNRLFRDSLSIFAFKIGCDPKPIYEMLGGEEGINNKNIMTYLGLIEQKTTTFLTVMYFMQLKVNITN